VGWGGEGRGVDVCEIRLTGAHNSVVRVSENKALWMIFGPKRHELRKLGKNFVMRIFIICTIHLILVY
jgi:hypothetical protein